jgi:hypothetical protein
MPKVKSERRSSIIERLLTSHLFSQVSLSTSSKMAM